MAGRTTSDNVLDRYNMDLLTSHHENLSLQLDCDQHTLVIHSEYNYYCAEVDALSPRPSDREIFRTPDRERELPLDRSHR